MLWRRFRNTVASVFVALDNFLRIAFKEWDADGEQAGAVCD
jgi:hypothetical protein